MAARSEDAWIFLVLIIVFALLTLGGVILVDSLMSGVDMLTPLPVVSIKGGCGE